MLDLGEGLSLVEAAGKRRQKLQDTLGDKLKQLLGKP